MASQVSRTASSGEQTRWQQKGGRRWDTATYPYGNDAQEVSREEMEHDLFVLLWRKNFFAPVKAPGRILDVACGIGLWGLQVLQQLPKARLTALDISSVSFKHFLTKPRAQQYVDVLDRIDFVQADVTQQLPFEAGIFDFVHARSLDTFLSERNWPCVIGELNRVTKPDGWVEIFAGGHFYTEEPSPVCAALVQAAIQLCQAIDIAPTGGPGIERYLQEAGIHQYEKREQLMPNLRSPQDKIERARELLIKDLKHVLANGRELIIQFNILPAEQFDFYMAQFEQEALRAGIVMPMYRVLFQPQMQSAPSGTAS